MADGFIKVGETKGGKAIGYRPDPDGYALYSVCFADGGELPALLKGKKFLNWKDAEFEINYYLDHIDKPKAKSKGKVNATG